MERLSWAVLLIGMVGCSGGDSSTDSGTDQHRRTPETVPGAGGTLFPSAFEEDLWVLLLGFLGRELPTD